MNVIPTEDSQVSGSKVCAKICCSGSACAFPCCWPVVFMAEQACVSLDKFSGQTIFRMLWILLWRLLEGNIEHKATRVYMCTCSDNTSPHIIVYSGSLAEFLCNSASYVLLPAYGTCHLKSFALVLMHLWFPRMLWWVPPGY